MLAEVGPLVSLASMDSVGAFAKRLQRVEEGGHVEAHSVVVGVEGAENRGVGEQQPSSSSTALQLVSSTELLAALLCNPCSKVCV